MDGKDDQLRAKKHHRMPGHNFDDGKMIWITF
jgi:hypothetical protein